MEKYGAKPIPSKFAEFLTNKSILEYLSDEYHYVRLIKGMPFQKVIYGTINLSDTDKNNLKQLGIDVHDYSEIK